MTTPKEEGLKPCEHCGKQPVRFGLADAYRCEPCMKNSGWMSKKDWNHRPATDEQGLREALEVALNALQERQSGAECEHGFSPPTNCTNKKCEDRDEWLACRVISAALSHAPAPQIICTCREGSSLPEGQHFVGCGLYKFPVPESERRTR